MEVKLRNYILIKMQTNQKDLTLTPNTITCLSRDHHTQRQAKNRNMFLILVTHSWRSPFVDFSLLVISTLF